MDKLKVTMKQGYDDIVFYLYDTIELGQFLTFMLNRAKVEEEGAISFKVEWEIHKKYDAEEAKEAEENKED